jgi:hypothetical protein
MSSAGDPLVSPIPGAERREIGGLVVEIVRAANGRIKRTIYPPGYRWSTHMKSVVGTEHCMHAHVGFLARGRLAGEYHDGCAFEYAAPAAVVIEPGHDGWVVGDEDVVLIQFDAEEGTARRFGLPAIHGHDA